MSFGFFVISFRLGGGFEEAVASRGGVSTIRSLSARNVSHIDIEVGVGSTEEPTLWSYVLHFTKQPKTERPKIVREEVRHKGDLIAARPDSEDAADPERLTQTYLQQVSRNQAYRELADFLGSIRYRHLVPQLIREPERSVTRTEDPFGGDFLEQIANTPKKTRDARLKRIQKALQVAVPQLTELELKVDNRGFWHLVGRY